MLREIFKTVCLCLCCLSESEIRRILLETDVPKLDMHTFSDTGLRIRQQYVIFPVLHWLHSLSQRTQFSPVMVMTHPVIRAGKSLIRSMRQENWHSDLRQELGFSRSCSLVKERWTLIPTDRLQHQPHCRYVFSCSKKWRNVWLAFHFY